MTKVKTVHVIAELASLTVLVFFMYTVFRHARVSGVAWDSFFRLAQVGLVIGAYFIGRYLADHHPETWRNYLMVMYVVGAFSFFAWARYGTHVEDADPLFGGGEIVGDFVPTEVQRSNHALSIFLTYAIAARYGVYKKRNPY